MMISLFCFMVVIKSPSTLKCFRCHPSLNSSLSCIAGDVSVYILYIGGVHSNVLMPFEQLSTLFQKHKPSVKDCELVLENAVMTEADYGYIFQVRRIRSL